MSLSDRAFMLLREHAPRRAVDLADLVGCRVGELIAAMDYDGRFRRVAGAGVWDWTIDGAGWRSRPRRARKDHDQVEEIADAPTVVARVEAVGPGGGTVLHDAGVAPAAAEAPAALALVDPPKPPLVRLTTTADRIATFLATRRDAGLGGASVCFLAPALRIDRQHVEAALAGDPRFRMSGRCGDVVWWALAERVSA